MIAPQIPPYSKMLRRPVEYARYTGLAFGKRCTEMGVKLSMDTAGDAYDNAMAKNLFSTSEYELTNRSSWQIKSQTRLAVLT